MRGVDASSRGRGLQTRVWLSGALLSAGCDSGDDGQRVDRVSWADDGANTSGADISGDVGAGAESGASATGGSANPANSEDGASSAESAASVGADDGANSGDTSGEGSGGVDDGSAQVAGVDDDNATSASAVIDGSDPDVDGSSCEGDEIEATLRGTSIVIMYDISSSWGSNGTPYWRRDLKWEPTLAASKAFFGDPTTAGLFATLTFFPSGAAQLSGSSIAFGAGLPSPIGDEDAGVVPAQATPTRDFCATSEYVEPDVPLTALPTDVFAAAIDAVAPEGEDDWRMGSPMEAVLEASFIAADDLRAERPDDDVFILLLTDGMPALCESAQSDIEPSVAVVAELGNAPLYVVGVRDPVTEEEPSPPDEATPLNQLTRASGTGDAHLIATGDPAITEAEVAAALRDITSQRSCAMALPETGSIDPEQLSVSLGQGSAREPLVYDPASSAGEGWRFDDADAPSQVALCPDSCAEARDPAAAVAVYFAARCVGSPVP